LVYDYINQWKWRVSSSGYADTTIGDSKLGIQSAVYMHRIILENYYNDRVGGLEVDHIDQNKLNNQRSNLRVVSSQQNSFNQGVFSSNTSGHKGVYWNKDVCKWRAYITFNLKTHHLGYFDHIEEAAAARLEAETKLYKMDSAIGNLNFQGH